MVVLDAHSQMILDEYRENLPLFREAEGKIVESIKAQLNEAGILVAGLESRIKSEDSLAGKLELKGHKYKSLADITDIIGVRVITFYSADLGKVASAIERLFVVDWENSVDKRKLLSLDSFGYMSLHYVCRIPGLPYKAEVQMRTLLQHAWANLNHDTGYKSGVEVPKEYIRSLNRLAGLLELADEEFGRIRSELADYRRRVQALVASGNLDEVPLDGETFRSYLNVGPFDRLNKRIASINQAEIQEVPLMSFLQVFKGLRCNTLGDVARLVKEYSEYAYQIACYQMGLTDLDIISSSIGPQNLCIAILLKNGTGKHGLRYLFDALNGESEGNDMLADMIFEQAKDLPFMNQ